jgi:hypothetical protein
MIRIFHKNQSESSAFSSKDCKLLGTKYYDIFVPLHEKWVQQLLLLETYLSVLYECKLSRGKPLAYIMIPPDICIIDYSKQILKAFLEIHTFIPITHVGFMKQSHNVHCL